MRVEPLGGSREKVAEVRSVLVDDLKEVEERAKLAILQGKEDTSQMEEVDAIKADTYAKEEEEEARLLEVVNGLDGVLPQTVLDNQGDDVELLEDGSEKVVKEKSFRINDLESILSKEIETSKALLFAQAELKVQEKDSWIKKGLEDLSEVTEHAENLQRQVDALAAKGACSEGNANLRECQHKLDAALIREKVLEWEIRAKDSLLKKKDDLLKDLPAREELEAQLRMIHARRLKTRFTKVVIPDVSRSDLLMVIIAYLMCLELERDTLLKTLPDKGCICRAEIDRGNCLGVMETQLRPRTADLVE
ncbi:hypothetical protein GIB67_040961 [Kingdonia uniflora]|uniref:Uncharacterized protein n=1 Tax=Kingdonia uniflora TaxID=39325 RepID=A0A7J7NBS0_9MAGN|nr:hypothetical protein GIB67_040961 [Kingdonia uniflora]